MKPFVTMLVGLAAALTHASAEAAPCGADEAALRRAKIEIWPSYYRNQDVAGLGGFLVENFTLVGGDGEVTTRAEELAWVQANPWPAQDFVYTITRIDCPAPDVAVIVGNGRSVRVGEGGARVLHNYTSSNVLVRERGRWRAAMSHVSGERTEKLRDR